MERPRILLTNDDGIDAPGMERLLELLSPLPGEVAVAAPKRNHSGAGHAITLGREIEILPLPPQGRARWRWQIDGTPVDAVKYALDNGAFAPDLVISGINAGPNMGNNIHYSGTVGAALEAFFHGVPAVALSVENPHAPLWDTAIVWGRKILGNVFARLEGSAAGGPPFLLNVNFPDLAPEAVKGVRLTRQGRNGFREKFHPGPSGRPNHYLLDGEMVFPDTEPDIDTVAVQDGYVSATPLHALMNCAHARPWLETTLAGL
ncbi:MAG: 5'/3'-nucleotidase SurE [Planctomycetes bacterium]|nr:5'/3'-nucleotidase SurE [Planctomycetota bacterium]